MNAYYLCFASVRCTSCQKLVDKCPNAKKWQVEKQNIQKHPQFEKWMKITVRNRRELLKASEIRSKTHTIHIKNRKKKRERKKKTKTDELYTHNENKKEFKLNFSCLKV